MESRCSAAEHLKCTGVVSACVFARRIRHGPVALVSYDISPNNLSTEVEVWDLLSQVVGSDAVFDTSWPLVPF